jgi:hypothetical protein
MMTDSKPEYANALAPILPMDLSRQEQKLRIKSARGNSMIKTYVGIIIEVSLVHA